MLLKRLPARWKAPPAGTLRYLMRILGFGFRAPKIPVPSTNVAGRVEAVGKNVNRFHVGDEVYGTCRGAFAEYARASQAKLASKPNSLTFEQTAVVPYGGFAAWQAVHDRGLSSSTKPCWTSACTNCVLPRTCIRTGLMRLRKGWTRRPGLNEPSAQQLLVPSRLVASSADSAGHLGGEGGPGGAGLEHEPAVAGAGRQDR
jgi:alcohol dehydrogenase-like protein